MDIRVIATCIIKRVLNLESEHLTSNSAINQPYNWGDLHNFLPLVLTVEGEFERNYF